MSYQGLYCLLGAGRVVRRCWVNFQCRGVLQIWITVGQGVVGWSGGAMVLGKLPVPGRPTIWITVGQGPTALAVGAGGGCLDIFTLLYLFSPLSTFIYPFFPLSPSLRETARYRLKYCLKGPLNSKQPTILFANRIFHRKQDKSHKIPNTPKMTIRPIQYITVEKSTGIHWVKPHLSGALHF